MLICADPSKLMEDISLVPQVHDSRFYPVKNKHLFQEKNN